MEPIAKSIKQLSKEIRIKFAKDMILNRWDNLSAKQINFFSRYIRMFDKEAA